MPSGRYSHGQGVGRFERLAVDILTTAALRRAAQVEADVILRLPNCDAGSNGDPHSTGSRWFVFLGF